MKSKLLNNKKVIIAFSICIFILIATTVLSVIAIDYKTTSFKYTFDELKSTENKNVFCDEKSAHFSIDHDGDKIRECHGASWNFTRGKYTDKDGNVKNYPRTRNNDEFGYIIAKATGNHTGYYDIYQEAWWLAKGQIANEDASEDAKKLVAEAEAYETYRKDYSALKISNLTRKSNSKISFDLSGSHDDTNGFGKITKIEVYNAATNKLIKTVAGTYGTNTIDGLDAYGVYIKVYYDKTTVSATMSKYEATSWSCAHGSGTDGGQPLVIFDGSISNSTKDKTSGHVDLKTNVSLQKFITKVNGNNLTNSETNLPNRGNTYSSKDESNDKAKKVPAKIEENHMQNNRFKRDNVVNVAKGDTVTYRIYVYNNADMAADQVVVKDRLLYYNTSSQYGEYIIQSIIRDGKTDVGGQWYYVPGTSPKEYQYTIYNLPANSYTYFDITVKLNTYLKDKIIGNTAYIDSTVPNNDTNYRTVDRDYIKMKPYDVSLQKFITKVNGNDLTSSETNLQNRGNTYSSKDESNDKAKKVPAKIEENYMQNDKFKLDDVVNIEAGDTVTYRIFVYNNADTTPDNVVIRDKLLYYGNNNQYGEYEIESITRDGNARDIKNEWTYVGGTLPHEYQYTIYNLAANSCTYFDITVKLKTYLKDTVIVNTAYIYSTAPDNDTEYRTVDRDYVKMKPYKVSLQKIVYSVNGKTEGITSFDRWSSWESNANINNSPSDETYNRDNMYAKHNNPVTVANGEYVTYAIKVRNDGNTKVYINNIKDTLPEGLSEYKQGNYNSSEQYKNVPNDRIINLKINRILNPGDEATLYVTAKVSESNMSTRLLRNYAEITNISNKNNVPVEDSTLANNQDADYIQMKDIVIEGTVWNDRKPDKEGEKYNEIYNNEENKLSGIKVYLYRNGKGFIADTKTDDNGNYHFDSSMIYDNIHTCERYIKAPYECTSSYSGNTIHGANYWKENGYYSYYIVFEYDGITYTSTPDGKTCVSITDNTAFNNGNYKINSNAKEDNGPVKEPRKAFNDKFSKIDKDGAYNTNGEKTTNIGYTTKNEKAKDGNRYIPESIHKYDEETMSMQSSTDLIKLSADANLEEQLKYVNLGLRGRDIFDLHLLKTDVYSTKVTVNGQTGEYDYNNDNDSVTIRKSDIGVAEDAANFANEIRERTVLEETQKIRDTDLSEEIANQNAKNGYVSTGLEIEVTYKITVTNESQTLGTASKVIDYYDNVYSYKGAYKSKEDAANDKNRLGIEAQNEEPKNEYNSVIIKTPQTQLADGETMEIYVVLTLNDATTTLSSLLNGTKKIPTYNMAEIYEYTTKCGADQTEYTRGLLDKDSAPGSVEKEQVRTTETEGVNTPTTGGNPTTVKYYFGGNDLSKLKYEDDTSVAPILYFAKDENGRTLSGVVFRDNTETDNNTRIKTGNGIKDENEVGVYGATVKFIEGKTVRYETTTDENGNYTFTGFLPGNYTIEYSYGDTKNTVLLNQYQDKDVNKYSFNGEDYQSTNNIGAYGAKKLNDTKDIWYAYNEKDKISTGTDNETRREKVTKNVTNFTDEEMTVLNNARDGKEVSEKEVNKLIEDTKMYAATPNFTLSVEKTETDNDNKNPLPKKAFSTYKVENMNFGIAEVPVTTIDLQKHVQSFEIKDSAGDNIIASAMKNKNGTWTKKGDVIPLEGSMFDVSIEDEKLQGARLQVTYNVSISMTTEKDFRNRELTVPTIEGIADYVDNDLSYNENLYTTIDGKEYKNSDYWQVDTYENVKRIFALSQYKEGTVPTGTIDGAGQKYTTVLVAKDNNPILLKETGSASCPITLEKTLSAAETTVEDIITSNINTYEYDNNVEILKLNYQNTNPEGDGSIPYRDRVRTPERYIILAGTQHDSAASEPLSIIPPLGENNSINYYIIAVISLGILAAGAFGIKKFVVKK